METLPGFNAGPFLYIKCPSDFIDNRHFKYLAFNIKLFMHIDK